MRGLFAVLVLFPAIVNAQTDLNALTPAERESFGTEVRETLLAHPELVSGAVDALAGRIESPITAAYREIVTDDISLLERLAPDILGGADIALFVSETCVECADAIEDLKEITVRSGTNFILRDIAEMAHWAESLELDAAPFYVMRKMVLRGRMPPVVLEKYLSPRQ